MYLTVSAVLTAVSARLMPSHSLLITATYLGQVALHVPMATYPEQGQVALHVPMATYLDRMLLHVAHVCSLDSSAHQTLVPSHSLIDHGNLTWSGGAACTHGNQP